MKIRKEKIDKVSIKNNLKSLVKHICEKNPFNQNILMFERFCFGTPELPVCTEATFRFHNSYNRIIHNSME